LPGLNPLPQNRSLITSILDTAWSPVAKFRLLSGGVSPNHLLEGADNIVGQRECIACGNCVDNCPVVLRDEQRIDLQAHRTSLHLEEIVEDNCLRCYTCIRVCPQVDPHLKLFAAKHRFPEKIIHWWMAFGYLILAPTGIAINHFSHMWTEQFVTWVSFFHKLGAIVWLLSPILFFIFDRKHFNRTMSAVFSLGKKDWEWWKQAFRGVFKKGEWPFQGEYNSGQKYWYMVVLGTMLILGVTGIVRWIWEPTMAVNTLNTFILIHIIFAYVIDINFAYHFGRKILSRALIRYRNYRHISELVFLDDDNQNEKLAKGAQAVTAQSSQKVSM
jgi:cytochrome b subunit of formate dehydrogenase/NAD-dependent dihydropyrimidine dehydrogenase PreA subunit